MTGTGQRTVAIVDDDDGVRESLRFLLEVIGYTVVTFASAADFLKKSGIGGPAYLRHAKDDDEFIRAVDPKWSGALPATLWTVTTPVGDCVHTPAVVAPSGNPITVQTGTPVPCRLQAAARTQVGLTQTDAKRYLAASSHNFLMSSSVASGFRSV